VSKYSKGKAAKAKIIKSYRKKGYSEKKAKYVAGAVMFGYKRKKKDGRFFGNLKGKGKRGKSRFTEKHPRIAKSKFEYGV
jgi:hypothetical protein